jgi:MFS family permease
MALVMVVPTFCATILVDKIGRRPLLLISSALMALSLGTLYYIRTQHSHFIYQYWKPAVIVSIFIFAFNLGFGPLPWMMMGELFSASAKCATIALTATFSWFMALTVPYSTQLLLDISYEKTTLALFASCVGAFFFVIFAVPETKGKSIAEIQRELGPRAGVN